MRKCLLVSMLCAVLLSSTLFGCGTQQPTGAPSSPSETITATQPAETPKAAEETAAPAETKLDWNSPDISWRKNTTPVTLKLFVDYTWWPMDFWGKDEVSQYITKQTGVNLDMTKATTGDGGELQVMLAGGSLPDLVYFARADMDGLFQKDSVCYSYSDLINEYCPELMYLIDPVQIFLNTATDGKVYSIKSHYFNDADWADPRNVAGPGSGGFHYRKDVYEAIGSPDLSTIEGIEAAFAKVKEKYPDMIGFLPYWDTMNQFFGATNGLVKSGDKITIGVTETNYHDFMKLMNSFVRKGYIPREGLIYTYEQFLQAMRSGKVFSASYNTLLSDEENNFNQSNNLTGVWTPYTQVPTVNGQKMAKTYYQSIGWSSLYITKNCKLPDRAILLYEYLKSPEGDKTSQFGIEGVHWTARDDGYIQRTDEFLKKSIAEAGVGPGYGLWCFGASGLNESILNSSVALSNPQFCSSLDLQKMILTYIDRDPLMYFAVPVAGTDENDKYGKMNQLITDTRTKLFLAADETEFEAVYTDMVNKLNGLGLADLETYMTNSYNKAQAGYQSFVAGLK